MIQMFQSDFSVCLLPFLNICFVFMDYVLMICFIFLNVYKLLFCQLNLILYLASIYDVFLVIFMSLVYDSSSVWHRLQISVCCLFLSLRTSIKAILCRINKGLLWYHNSYPTCQQIKVPCSFASICFQFFELNLTGLIIQACFGYFF